MWHRYWYAMPNYHTLTHVCLHTLTQMRREIDIVLLTFFRGENCAELFCIKCVQWSLKKKNKMKIVSRKQRIFMRIG